MKQTLLIMVLALGMCSIKGSAQEKKYKVEDDGFEWYEIRKYSDGYSYHGAQDKFGNTIIPLQKDMLILYRRGGFVIWDGNKKHGFVDKEGHLIVPMEYDSCEPYDQWGVSHPYIEVLQEIGGEIYTGMYDYYGKCILPISRRYQNVYLLGKDKNVYWLCNDKRNGPAKFTLCDISGKEFYSSSKTYGDCYLVKHPTRKNMFALILSEYGKTYSYFIDKKENVLLEAWITDSSFHNDHNADITRRPKEIQPKGGNKRILTQAEVNKIYFSADWLDGNAEYFAHAAEYPMCKIGQNGMATGGGSNQQQSGQQQQHTGGTSTIVVEHHRDPIPVQEWQQCPACYGSGQCPNVSCGGSGWYYIGDKARTCSRCHGSGKCTICAGRGGQNVTVYR